MATYIYRLADGSVGVCDAKNKDEALWLFDEKKGAHVSAFFFIIERMNPNLLTLTSCIPFSSRPGPRGRVGQPIPVRSPVPPS